MKIKYFSGIIATALLALVAAGCQKQGPTNGRCPSIMPNVSSDETKGYIITTGGINQTGQSFLINGYLDDSIKSQTGENIDEGDKSDFHFIKDATLSYTGSSWNWSGSDPLWRGNIPIRFWSSYPATAPSGLTITWPHDVAAVENQPTNAQQKILSFTYTLPTPATAAPYQDAESQMDLLFAFNEEQRVFKNQTEIDATNSGNSGTNKHTGVPGQYDNYIDIHFYHALAAVNFDITTIEDDVEFGTEITLVNVSDYGECTATGSGNTVGYEWENWSTPNKSYSQSFNKADDFEDIEIESTGDTYVRQKTSGNKTFFMIPQTLTDATKLKIAFIFKNGGVPITREMEIGKFNPTDTDYVEWKAGKLYTYRINVGGGDYTLLDVSLDVKDWVDGSMETSF